jgi:ribosomal protein S18 acetylase RimI-like enzyme
MNEISVRRATRDDLDRIAGLFDLYRQFYEQPADADLAARYIRQRFDNGESVLFVAGTRAQPVSAFCQLYPTFCSVAAAPTLVLYDLFTAPDSRGLGLGRALLLAAEQYARSEGCVRMDLATARSNVSAQRLYESLGWIRDEVFFTYNRRITG